MAHRIVKNITINDLDRILYGNPKKLWSKTNESQKTYIVNELNAIYSLEDEIPSLEEFNETAGAEINNLFYFEYFDKELYQEILCN